MFEKKGSHNISEEKKQLILAKIKPIIAKQLGVGENNIALSSRIVDDLGADSLDSIEMIMSFEEAFSIEIMDEDAEKMKTVDDIVVYLDRRSL